MPGSKKAEKKLKARRDSAEVGKNKAGHEQHKPGSQNIHHR